MACKLIGNCPSESFSESKDNKKWNAKPLGIKFGGQMKIMFMFAFVPAIVVLGMFAMVVLSFIGGMIGAI